MVMLKIPRTIASSTSARDVDVIILKTPLFQLRL